MSKNYTELLEMNGVNTQQAFSRKSIKFQEAYLDASNVEFSLNVEAMIERGVWTVRQDASEYGGAVSSKYIEQYPQIQRKHSSQPVWEDITDESTRPKNKAAKSRRNTSVKRNMSSEELARLSDAQLMSIVSKANEERDNLHAKMEAEIEAMRAKIVDKYESKHNECQDLMNNANYILSERECEAMNKAAKRASAVEVLVAGGMSREEAEALLK